MKANLFFIFIKVCTWHIFITTIKAKQVVYSKVCSLDLKRSKFILHQSGRKKRRKREREEEEEEEEDGGGGREEEGRGGEIC